MNTEALWSKALHVWSVGHSYALDALNYLDRLRLFTPEHSHALIVGGAAILTIPVAWIALSNMHGRRRIALASMTIPLFLIVMLQVPTGFHGTPDDNCAKYGSGELEFVLISSAAVPKQRSDVYGQEWLLLLVRAPKRWGDEPHQCRLPLSDERFRRLADAIHGAQIDSSGSYARSGQLHFTFGSTLRGEAPNVTFWRTTPNPGKTGPPEVPPGSQRDT